MFGFIIFIVVLFFVSGLFSRPYRGYHRHYGGFGSCGMGHRFGPMGCGPHHHHHHHHQMGHGHCHHMGHGRRW